MEQFLQDDRPIGVETPLGKDKLVLNSFSGEERMSGLFRFDLQLLSDDGGIKPVDIVGKDVDCYVRYPDGTPRYFNGIVNRFAYAGQSDRSHLYRAQVVPWAWLLTKGADCRIWQQMSAKDIIDALLSELGFSDFAWDVKRTPVTRVYCVQYRETHYDFITRLLSEEGIYFYFLHQQGKHVMKMSDHVDGVFDCRDAEVQLLSNLSQPEITDNLTGWEHEYEFTTGKWALADYNFETPSTSLLVNKKTLVPLPDSSRFEVYDSPGEYGVKGDGDTLSRLRMEAEEAGYDTISGGSECRSFSPGGRFTVTKHHNAGEEGGQYVLTAVQHSAHVGGSYVSGGSHSDEIYQNQFRSIPAPTIFRPPHRPRPGVHGVQSAVVVGPAGEEIYTDEFGRIKVQFHWDRLGKNDENSSCWIRVSQVHAGQGWGMMDLPRIGEEVIVCFEEGNADRPLVIGRVYNGENSPPFALPAEKTRRGNTTKSHKAGGYNEMSMDDTAGAEQIRINAQHNMDTKVGNNQTLDVAVDRTVTIGSNEATTIGADQTLDVGNNRTASVGTDENIEIGANQTYRIGSDQNGEIGGTRGTTISGDDNLNATSQNVALSGDQNTDVSGSITIKAGTTITIEAGVSIELIVGGSTVRIDQAGVSIKGVVVKAEGDATASMKSPATSINGDATLTLMGGMTKIN
ncbi:MAG: type VI secretion system tip protein TssI/VgrG [Planctomycetaceae bacterium]